MRAIIDPKPPPGGKNIRAIIHAPGTKITSQQKATWVDILRRILVGAVGRYKSKNVPPARRALMMGGGAPLLPGGRRIPHPDGREETQLKRRVLETLVPVGNK